ncbi:hypothetical protein KEJ34_03865 [Candidatus Bathyarchaeota archaeon]|nr:hypothetical protein [Candidatus Bathyarchaeota archaeon]
MLRKRITRIMGRARNCGLKRIQPSEHLIMLFKWSLVTLLALVALEIAHLAFLGE